MLARISQRTDTFSNWTTNNPILLNGEFAIVLMPNDTYQIKIGNGETNFNNLPFYNNFLISAQASAGQILAIESIDSNGVINTVWKNDKDTTYNVATNNQDGLLSAADKIKLDNVISGTTAGTSTALTLAANGFTLTDGAVIRFCLHTTSGATPTLNVNNTGAKPIMTSTKVAMPTTEAGIWVTAIYSEALDFFVLQGSVDEEVILQSKTITPTKSSQTVIADEDYDGLDEVTINPIPDEYITTNDATATAEVVGLGETFYANGVKGTGTFTLDDELDTQEDKLAELLEALEGKSAGAGSGGNSEAFKQLIEGTLTEISDDRVTTIRTSAFYNCGSLTSVNFPVCTTIGSYAFRSCSSLTTANFPVCTTIGGSAFYNCSSLTTVSFPKCTTINDYAFRSCISLTTANFPVCTKIGNNAFAFCKSLTTISFPVCTYINMYAFNNCISLTSVNFPVCTYISSGAFRTCYNLTTLILGASTVCTLFNSNAFTSTPIGGYSASAGKYGTIYVPASLLASYQAATNWTYFSSRFSTIDSPK